VTPRTDHTALIRRFTSLASTGPDSITVPSSRACTLSACELRTTLPMRARTRSST